MLLYNRILTPQYNPMKNTLFAICISLFLLQNMSVYAEGVKSPDGKLAVTFHLNEEGAPRYVIVKNDKPVLDESRLGLIRDDANFSTGLHLIGKSPIEPVRDRYEILTAKRRINDYQANRVTYHLETADGKKIDVIFQVSNDGVAFRYFFPEKDAKIYQLKEEISSFHFLSDTKAWLQPMAVAKSGWEKTNPSYEENYQKEIPVGKASPTGAGWVYPALFRSGDTWLLISESSLGRTYCGTRLRSESPNGEYSVGFADPREVCFGGPAKPESKLPWLTPWRIVVVGSLKTIAESTLGIDLADPPAKPADSSIQPGQASWSWVLLKDNNTKYNVQKQFIDYAADMHWKYCLIDADWPKLIGEEKIKELADYAKSKNVGIILWYNSAGDWNTSPQGPRDKMLTHESRIKEFEKLKAMGIVGLKIDFFGGDGQSVIAYYHDIMEDAQPFGLSLNFHGATLPRGWQRTYPHLMTMEAIRGMEFITFGQDAANQAPTHIATIPFTRNVFDPMDFTPMVLDTIPNIKRRTTSGFELATSILMTSGIQHFAEIPKGMAKTPDYVKEFLKNVPAVWDDIKFLDGYPGKFVVLARKGNGRWYLAGINAEKTEKKIELDLSQFSPSGSGKLIQDGSTGNLSFQQSRFTWAPNQNPAVIIPPNGGFIAILD